ncbi:hypothetical protein [Grapevine Roditis leaf discoloration-associated virus]|uniref:Uncharacterized protein n=1 Tax=Grapevine Roditis leaf discoloration-associated virus TaxID=1471299 RepID=A0A0F7RQZ1_9VIRU|nr:hypothetical protein [Grapevine Roditis leaf discoloration-associated virus]CDN68222.1 hypothetical protein [Grapevine Roditis leaf discoloration-associated virus]
MSEKWERSIQDWYNNSRTANLEYLDLAEKEKPTNTHLFHNLAVVYDRLNLQSRVNLKNLKHILERIERQELRLENLEKSVKNLTKVFVENKPLTAIEVRRLVQEISQQPKLVEREALKLTEELRLKLERVEVIVKKVESWANS